MWIIAKINLKEKKIFEEKVKEIVKDKIEFYSPKFFIEKHQCNKLRRYDKYLMNNYIFCYSKNFVRSKTLAKLKYVKGLQYFLSGYIQSQKEIVNFIEKCKLFEDKLGYLKPSFFKVIISKKAQFISGPFTNLFFEIIKKEKNKLKILIGNITTTISNDKNYLYQPV